MIISINTYDIRETEDQLRDLDVLFCEHSRGGADAELTRVWIVGQEHVLREACRRLDEEWDSAYEGDDARDVLARRDGGV